MQTIEIHTQGGLKHKVQTEVYNAEVLNTKLNDNDLITVLIGDFIIRRIDVKRIIPLNTIDVEGAKTVEVHTNAGKVIEINTNDYDPIYLNEQLNNNNTITVVIGDYIFSRIDVKQVVPVPVKEESKEPEKPPVTVPEQPTDQVTPPITEEPPGETGEGSTTVSQTEPTE